MFYSGVERMSAKRQLDRTLFYAQARADCAAAKTCRPTSPAGNAAADYSSAQVLASDRNRISLVSAEFSVEKWM